MTRQKNRLKKDYILYSSTYQPIKLYLYQFICELIKNNDVSTSFASLEEPKIDFLYPILYTKTAKRMSQHVTGERGLWAQTQGHRSLVK